jgi:hypothetical protein
LRALFGGGDNHWMHRPTVGIIALLLLLLGLFSFVLGEREAAAGWGSGCLRVGLLMGALWLALPVLKGTRPIWAVIGLLVLLALGVAMLFAAKHPFSMALIAAIALVLGCLTMASRSRGSR